MNRHRMAWLMGLGALAVLAPLGAWTFGSETSVMTVLATLSEVKDTLGDKAAILDRIAASGQRDPRTLDLARRHAEVAGDIHRLSIAFLEAGQRQFPTYRAYFRDARHQIDVAHGSVIETCRRIAPDGFPAGPRPGPVPGARPRGGHSGGSPPPAGPPPGGDPRGGGVEASASGAHAVGRGTSPRDGFRGSRSGGPGPDPVAAYREAYRVYALGGPQNLMRARRMLEEVLERDPGVAMARYWLGRILLEQGRIDEAATQAEFLTRAFPDRQVSHDLLRSVRRSRARASDPGLGAGAPDPGPAGDLDGLESASGTGLEPGTPPDARADLGPPGTSASTGAHPGPPGSPPGARPDLEPPGSPGSVAVWPAAWPEGRGAVGRTAAGTLAARPGPPPREPPRTAPPSLASGADVAPPGSHPLGQGPSGRPGGRSPPSFRSLAPASAPVPAPVPVPVPVPTVPVPVPTVPGVRSSAPAPGPDHGPRPAASHREPRPAGPPPSRSPRSGPADLPAGVLSPIRGPVGVVARFEPGRFSPWGMSLAAVLVEEPAPTGLSRWMGIFPDRARSPGKVGPLAPSAPSFEEIGRLLGVVVASEGPESTSVLSWGDRRRVDPGLPLPGFFFPKLGSNRSDQFVAVPELSGEGIELPLPLAAWPEKAPERAWVRKSREIEIPWGEDPRRFRFQYDGSRGIYRRLHINRPLRDPLTGRFMEAGTLVVLGRSTPDGVRALVHQGGRTLQGTLRPGGPALVDGKARPIRLGPGLAWILITREPLQFVARP